jgi:hypothetical protein
MDNFGPTPEDMDGTFPTTAEPQGRTYPQDWQCNYHERGTARGMGILLAYVLFFLILVAIVAIAANAVIAPVIEKVNTLP